MKNELYNQDRYWRYFLVIEKDIETISRYIEFEESNYKTYSIELAHILFAASSEVEVLLKEICNIVEPDKKPVNIKQYYKIISKSASGIIKTKIIMPKYNIKFSPFSKWADNENLEWWVSYNKVKHERNNFFNRANLLNALNSAAALYVANLQYMYFNMSKGSKDFSYEMRHVINRLNPPSDLFRVDDIFLNLEYI